MPPHSGPLSPHAAIPAVAALHFEQTASLGGDTAEPKRNSGYPMTQRDIISLIENESELLAALGAWARDKTMEDRAAKIRRIFLRVTMAALLHNWRG